MNNKFLGVVPVPSFVARYLKRREGLRLYRDKLNSFLEDRKMLGDEQKELDQIVADCDLLSEQIISAQKESVLNAYNKMTSDQRLSKEEVDDFEALCKYFKIDWDTLGINFNQFRKFYNMALIESGELPDVTEAEQDLPVIFKSGEILHYRTSSLLRKLKKYTKTFQYKGVTASVKIVKGFRYRAGSLNINRVKAEVMDVEDNGTFYITSQQVGFYGQRRQFALPFSKISSFELRDDGGLYIFKSGKELPYIVTLDDYEVPVAIISKIL